ncbi:MAG: hypothetical protein KAU01_07235 [Candidatus Cloacimonetes bacterium]|nr:hypothetical protein [Candidatus Cloacimonadota bacterium]
MKKIIFWMIITVILLFFACDRFEHSFEPTDDENSVEEFFSDFSESIANLPSPDVTPVLNFYHDDYNNNGTLKSDVEEFYSMFYIISIALQLQLEATLINYTENNDITWNLLVTTLGTKETFLDTTFIDVLIPSGDSYLFYGNQQELQKVLVELATSLTCVNCPYVEAALHNLKQQYGNRLSYIEYHINDPLDIGNIDIFSYYEMSALPTSVIQGTDIIVGGSATSQEELDAIIALIFEETPLVQFNDVNITIDGEELNGSVLLNIDSSVPLDDLYLKFILIENEDTENQNSAGENCLNVVKAKSELLLTQVNLAEPVDFLLPDLYDLPDDITLVIWVQTLEDPYNSSTCKVYNVTEKVIE